MTERQEEEQERQEDKQALDELRAAGEAVGKRTDRIIEAYRLADEARRSRKKRNAAP